MLEKLAQFSLSMLPPEFAHSIAKTGMKFCLMAPGVYHTEKSETKLFNQRVPNPFGIAAGFDKYAELQDYIQEYGFGWIEEGSFTFEGGKGNKKPRLFRDKENGGLINRMGLNCIPSEIAAERLSKSSPYSFAVSIAKTHNPEILGDEAIHDMVLSYRLLKNLGIYTAINVSCPNTKEGKTFEVPESFRELNAALKSEGKGKPLVYKFSPNLETETLQELVSIANDFADGYEIGNTLPINHQNYGRGGLSGPHLRKDAIDTIRNLRQLTSKTILGCGGISTGKDAYEMRKVGADVFLVFNGFVYRHFENPNAGPNFAHKVNKEFSELLLKK
ncbi:dihydroorotate dehydrogenase 2 [Candidatus Pacearchaeota archaeon]|nr:dihydroorotate dehydrogenase 2 [Candidatus Pacearchaeota archaeon]